MVPVSAIITTFNRAELCLKAVRSVYEQTCVPAQVILVDDGSGEDLEEVRELLRVNGGVYLRQDNRGVSAARNLGVEHATEEWVAFLDSDDQWLPTKLERQFALHLEDPEMSISQTAEIWVNQGVRVNQRKHHAPARGMCFERCLNICCISASAVMIRRRILIEAGGFDVSLPVCEDYDLWIRLTRKLAVGLVEEALVLKTRNGNGQLSQSVEAIDHYRVLALLKLIEGGLSPDQHTLAESALRKKLTILLAGARKRGRHEQVKQYEQVLQQF